MAPFTNGMGPCVHHQTSSCSRSAGDMVAVDRAARMAEGRQAMTLTKSGWPKSGVGQVAN